MTKIGANASISSMLSRRCALVLVLRRVFAGERMVANVLQVQVLCLCVASLGLWVMGQQVPRFCSLSPRKVWNFRARASFTFCRREGPAPSFCSTFFIPCHGLHVARGLTCQPAALVKSASCRKVIHLPFPGLFAVTLTVSLSQQVLWFV